MLTVMQRLLARRAVAAVQIGLFFWAAVSGQTAGRQVLHGRAPDVAAGLQPLGSLPDAARLSLAISLPLRNHQALAGLLQQIYDPASPSFHRYLAPSEFAEQFGPTKEDYQAVIDFAAANHLKVTGTHPNRTLLDVSASVGEIRRVFHVNMKVYAHPTENRTFYAPDADPSVDVDVPVLAIKGLDDFIRPHPDVRQAPMAEPDAPQPLAGSGTNFSYLGKDFRTAYAPGVSLNGAGQTAALVEFDGYYPIDITNYEKTPSPHLPAVPLTNVLVDGYSGDAHLNNSEVALDIEMLVAMAPGLSGIMVYEEDLALPDDDLFNRIATDDLAAQISCSWINIPIDVVSDQIFQQYAAQGQSFLCASGDTGACAPGQAGLEAADPHITIVGGTKLTTGTGAVWQSETVWSGSTGGFGTNYAIPYWQAGVSMSANGGSTNFRNLPDVAMCAANVFYTYNNGGSGVTAGTSCAAPLWAGFTALVNQQAALSGNASVGFLNPAIYAIGAGAGYAANFHDITNGNTTNSYNTGNYFAVAGYDLCTGWGTPSGSNLINTLAPPDTLVMLPIPGFASAGLWACLFSVTTESFSLSNAGSVSLNWSLSNDSVWVSAAPGSGVLNPGGTATVVASLNSAASALVPGDYAAHLTVTNLGNGLLHHRTFTLSISNPVTVSPATGLEFGGPPSGPFNAAAWICWITNASQASVNWSWLGSPSWLTVSPASGTLAPQSAVALTCSLNAAATNLPSGVYSSAVLFTNNALGAEESLPAVLLAGQLVQNGGFETGDWTDWTLAGDTSFTYVSSDSIAVHTGAYGAELGTSGSYGYLSQTIPTVPGQAYSISLWLDSPDGETPNGFMVSWNGITAWNYTNIPDIGWTNLQFTLAASGTNTVLEFGFRDDITYLGLDDVSVTAAPPTVGSLAPASGPSAGRHNRDDFRHGIPKPCHGCFRQCRGQHGRLQ